VLIEDLEVSRFDVMYQQAAAGYALPAKGRI
jgi:hypothetical protein